ncbi:MAG: zinc ribbon domain-containing protein [Thermoanaerobaculia bacterium]
MAIVEFTGNYQDLSTDKGYQFKFFCEKCGNGYMSSFRTSAIGLAASAVQVAGNLFGGLFSRAASTSYEVQRAVGGPAHDAALREAVEEIRPQFQQCTRCGKWVCGPVCFNHQAGLCEDCAPDFQQEVSAAQAEAAREQIHAKAREIDWVKDRDLSQAAAATCGSCGAKVAGGKFCPECGQPLAATKPCRRCGKDVEAAARFCPECGSPF